MYAVISKEEKEFIGSLYDEYYPFWYKTAYSMVHNDHTAQDMVNEAFTKLIPKCSRLMSFDKNALLAYVHITVANTCRNYLEKAGKTTVTDPDDEIISNISDGISVEDDCIKSFDISILKSIIMKLSEKERAFLIMSYYDELGDRIISKHLDIPYNNVRMYRTRLISKIRKMYVTESKVSRHE